MTDINTCTIIGNLTRDFELSYTSGGCAIGKGSIAINRSMKRGDSWEKETSFFEFTTFGKLGENLKPFMTKGKKIAINGWLKQDRWQDQNGNNRSNVKIVAQTIQLLGSKESPSGNSDQDDGFPEDIPFDNGGF